MAQINIPIEVLSNGQTQPHIRCAQIEFLPCDNLPPEHENPNQFVMEKMSAWLGGNNKTETFTESKHIPEPNSVGDLRSPTELVVGGVNAPRPILLIPSTDLSIELPPIWCLENIFKGNPPDTVNPSSFSFFRTTIFAK